LNVTLLDKVQAENAAKRKSLAPLAFAFFNQHCRP
jgi:hypothetical protein